MSYHEKIYSEDYYLPEEIACPRCKQEEKVESNPFNLCDACAEDFDREFQQDVQREVELWIKEHLKK